MFAQHSDTLPYRMDQNQSSSPKLHEQAKAEAAAAVKSEIKMVANQDGGAANEKV